MRMAPACAQGFFWLASHLDVVMEWSTAGASSRFAPYGTWLTPPAGSPALGDAAAHAAAPRAAGADQASKRPAALVAGGGAAGRPGRPREQRLVFIGEALPQVPPAAFGHQHRAVQRVCCCVPGTPPWRWQ
jgi:hypothetical protein